jgi:hypothetical protein
LVRRSPEAQTTPAPSAEQQDFSGASTTTEKLNDAYVATAPTAPATVGPTSAQPTPQFERPEAQAAFETYLENYRQMMMPPPIPRTEVIDASQIQASLETIAHAVLSVRQAEQNLKGILSPNELRAFKAYQNQLASPPAD